MVMYVPGNYSYYTIDKVINKTSFNLISGVIVDMLDLSVVDMGSNLRQTKDYKIGIFYFSTKHTVLTY